MRRRSWRLPRSLLMNMRDLIAEGDAATSALLGPARWSTRSTRRSLNGEFPPTSPFFLETRGVVFRTEPTKNSAVTYAGMTKHVSVLLPI